MTEKHMTTGVVTLVENVHDAEKTEVFYIDDMSRKRSMAWD